MMGFGPPQTSILKQGNMEDKTMLHKKAWDEEDADLSLRPIDIGFDLRTVNMPVRITNDIKSVILEIDGTAWWLSGTTDELIKEIRQAGFVVLTPDNT